MIYVDLGDTIVRLRVGSIEDGASILELIKSDYKILVDGVFRAMAMLKKVPTTEQIDKRQRLAMSRYKTIGADEGWCLNSA